MKKNNFIKSNYTGKIGTYNIIIDNELTNDCESELCDLCYKKDLNYCLVCSSNYTFISHQIYSKFKQCKEVKEEEDVGCSIKKIMYNQCINEPITIGQYKEIYQKLKNNLTIWNQSRENIIISTLNATYQMCTYKEQKYSDNKYVSNIDIGKCEEYLKLTYNIDDDLIIIKSDIKMKI